MSVNQAQRYATHSMRDPTGTARTAGLKESNPVHGSVRSEMSNHLSEVQMNGQKSSCLIYVWKIILNCNCRRFTFDNFEAWFRHEGFTLHASEYAQSYS